MEKDKRIEQFHMAQERYQLLYEEVSKIKTVADSKDLEFFKNADEKQEVLNSLEVLFEEAYQDSLLEEIHEYLAINAIFYVDNVKRKYLSFYDLSDVLERILHAIKSGLKKEKKKEVVYKVEKVFMEYAKGNDENFFLECAKHASEIARIIDINVIE